MAERTRGVAEGYRHVKLHETAEREVRAARETAGEGFPLMLDTNCPWTAEEARRMAARLAPYDLHWLEEPIFPPDDAVALARLRRETGVPLASGENACTAVQFRDLLAAGAVDYVQPSVTKVGGVTEFVQAAALAAAANVPVMPHSPYFGPGFLATLHLLAAQPRRAPRRALPPRPRGQPLRRRGRPGGRHVPRARRPRPRPRARPDVIRDYRVAA